MTYQDFYRLKIDATEFETYDDFLCECGGSVDPEELIILKPIWVYVRDGIKGILDLFDIPRNDLVKEYHIPYRTLQSWILGDREAPSYVVDLLAYAIITGINSDT